MGGLSAVLRCLAIWHMLWATGIVGKAWEKQLLYGNQWVGCVVMHVRRRSSDTQGAASARMFGSKQKEGQVLQGEEPAIILQSGLSYCWCKTQLL